MTGSSGWRRSRTAPASPPEVSATGAQVLAGRIDELRAARTQANAAFFGPNAEALARCCHRMAERFARGGRLIALGSTPQDRSDARHVAVEFVHPVIVGKRALPAIALSPEGGELPRQVEQLVKPDDIVVGFGDNDRERRVESALLATEPVGPMTIGFSVGNAEWVFRPRAGATEDTFIAQELVETLYHVLWELVHVFFDHKGLLEGREAGPVHDTGASSFLYPFLAEGESDLESVVEDVRQSVLLKAEEIGALREQTLDDNREVLVAAASALRERFERGGKLLAFGNGGSATDAIDLVADLTQPSGVPVDWKPRPAIDLTEDTGIITAVANDIGIEEIFQRQVIAYGREGDIAVALSTSGNSLNLIEALAEARTRGLVTVAFVGYDGGRIAQEGLADHVVVTRSQHIPRIQEAQASAYHVLRELIELADG
jgi:D-sedoheptulose 7-phosphate isomerase